MGMFTARSKAWEILNLFPIFISIITFFIPTSSLAFFYIGIMAKKRSWIILGVVSVFILFISFLIIGIIQMYFNSDALIMSLYLSLNLFMNFLLCTKVKGYLRRLDLRYKINLEWEVNYPYYETINNLVGKNVKNMNAVFLDELRVLKDKIDNINIKNNIDEIIRVSNLIVSKDPKLIDVIIVRHSNVLTKVLNQYEELEDAKLNNSSLKETKLKLEDIISISTKAISNELVKVYSNEIFDVDAETEVYLENLKKNNLI